MKHIRNRIFYSMLLLLSHVSRVWLCATPQMAVYQAPPSLGFSRQEHWSGLPFPSPVHESEKWKWSCSVVSDSLRPHGLQPTRLLCSWDFPGKSTGVGCHCLSLYLFIWPHCVACKILVSQPGIQPSPPAVEAQSPNHQTAREFLVWMCFWVRQSVAVFLHRKMSGRIHI